MQILMISGSRNPNGQTARAIAALEEGAKSAGCATETLFLPASDVERCRQCEDSGWGLCRKEARCVIEDGFAALVEKIRNANAVVFATPVYFSGLSESLRAFLDRFRRICVHGAKQDRIQGTPAVGICVAGGGGGGAPQCAVSLERTLTICGFEVVDTVPVRRQNLDMKVEVLRTVGSWLGGGPASTT